MSERPPGMPDDTPTSMAPAWVACLSWAIGHAETVAAFRAETGNRWEPGLTPLDRIIDQLTGADRAFVEAFIAWFNVNVWGPMDAPLPTPEPRG